MALDPTKWQVQADKDIRYIGPTHGQNGANYVTVLELHRWLQDLADDASMSGDDYMDITRDTPSDKQFDTIITLINGYNIDDTTAEYIYGGSIIQDNGDTIYDGIQIVANPGCHVQIVQNGQVLANDFWNSTPYGSSYKGINPDHANGISARFMIKVRANGQDIDGRRLLFQTREWGMSYSEFKINGTARGVNVVPLNYVTDLNNQTDMSTVATWTSITNENEGYVGIDVNNDGTPEYYYSKWTKATYTINQFYERMKWLTRRGSTSTLYGLNGQLFRGITHEINLTNTSGTFPSYGQVTWSGGTGQMLAVNASSNPTKMWIQLLTGIAPTDGQTLTVGSATAQVSGTPTERPLSQPFCGLSTGSALIGAYGFGMNPSSLSANDKLFDLTNTMRQAPNWVSFTVFGLQSGDRVLVTNYDSSTKIDYNQLSLASSLTGSSVTSVTVNEDIPADTPPSGTIRIQRNSGRYTRHVYTSWTGKTFTIESADFSSDNASANNNVFISYIDASATGSYLQFSTIYSADRNLFIRVRNGGSTPIKTFETTGTLGSAGGSVTAIRNSDL
jgi:hypothetical protein